MPYTPVPVHPKPAPSAGGGGGGGITLNDVTNAGFIKQNAVDAAVAPLATTAALNAAVAPLASTASVAATYATKAAVDAVAAGATNVTVAPTWVPANGLPAGTPVGSRILRRRS